MDSRNLVNLNRSNSNTKKSTAFRYTNVKQLANVTGEKAPLTKATKKIKTQEQI